MTTRHALTAEGTHRRHVPVHGARAARGQGGRRPQRPLRAGRAALRDGDGQARPSKAGARPAHRRDPRARPAVADLVDRCRRRRRRSTVSSATAWRRIPTSAPDGPRRADELRWIAQAAHSRASRPASAPPQDAREPGLDSSRPWLCAVAGWLVALSRSARPGTRAQGVLRTNSCCPEKLHLNSAVISPDGSRLRFQRHRLHRKGAALGPSPRLLCRRRRSPGTEGAILPFWSPDGRYIGFFADKKLKRVEVSGGCADHRSTTSTASAAPGHRAGDILFNAPSGPIHPSARGRRESRARSRVLDALARRDRTPLSLLSSRRPTLPLSRPQRSPATRGIRPTGSGWARSTAAPAKPVAPANFNAQYADGLSALRSRRRFRRTACSPSPSI